MGGGGPVGTPSYREYEPFNLDNEAHLRDWNLIVDRPNETKDMRWADCLRYFPYDFDVAPNCLPPASVHLPDSVVGQLLEMAKGGHIYLKTLGFRWPNIFNQEGKPHKSRRPMGDAFVVDDKIAAVNDGTQLLCGAKYKKKLPKGSDPPNAWYWLQKSIGKGRVIPTDLDPNPGKPEDQYSHWAPLSKEQMRANRQPKGEIFVDDSGLPSSQLKVEWKEDAQGWRKKRPWPVNSIGRKPDQHETAADLKEDWDDEEADLDTFEGRIGLIGFAMDVPDVTKHSKIMELTKADLKRYKQLAATKLKDETAEEGETPKSTRKHSESTESTPAKTKTPTSTVKKTSTPTPTSTQSPGSSRFMVRKSDVLSSSSSSDSDSESARSAEPAPTTPSNADALSLLAKLQQYEDAFARSTALTVQYVNDSKDLLQQVLKQFKTQAESRSDLKKFVKHVANRSDSYAQAFVSELGQAANVLDGSAYDLDRTFTANGAESTKWFPGDSIEDTLPEDMPGAASARARWSNKAAEYPVADLKSTDEYRRFAEGHLKKHKGSSFYRRRKQGNPNKYLDGEDSPGSGDDADEETVEPAKSKQQPKGKKAVSEKQELEKTESTKPKGKASKTEPSNNDGDDESSESSDIIPAPKPKAHKKDKRVGQSGKADAELGEDGGSEEDEEPAKPVETPTKKTSAAGTGKRKRDAADSAPDGEEEQTPRRGGRAVQPTQKKREADEAAEAQAANRNGQSGTGGQSTKAAARARRKSNRKERQKAEKANKAGKGGKKPKS